MKKLYILSTLLISSLYFSQSTISFEQSEGYSLGNINGQNGWTVTEANGSPVANQIVTNEVAKTGSYSFKNGYEPNFNFQYFPIFGGEKKFDNPLDYNNATISFDFYGNLQGESDFEIALYATNQTTQEFDILSAIGFENRSFIYLFPELNFGGFTYAEPKWQVNKWYNVRIEYKTNTVKYFLDDVEIYSGPNTSKVNIEGINFLHNNYGGDGYFDNLTVNGETLAVADFANSAVAVYPNPVKDILTIDLPNGELATKVEIYNTAGQQIKVFSDVKEINLNSLESGLYIVNIKSNNGKTFSKKIVKQ